MMLFPCDDSSGRPTFSTSNIHAFISSQCFFTSQHIPDRAQKHLWHLTSPRLCPPHIQSSHHMGWSISVVRTESGPWVLCPCGAVLLKVEQPPSPSRVRTHRVPEHRWSWTRARHSSLPGGKVAVATSMLRISDSGGFLVFSCSCCSGCFCFKDCCAIFDPRADSAILTWLERRSSSFISCFWSSDGCESKTLSPFSSVLVSTCSTVFTS